MRFEAGLLQLQRRVDPAGTGADYDGAATGTGCGRQHGFVLAAGTRVLGATDADMSSDTVHAPVAIRARADVRLHARGRLPCPLGIGQQRSTERDQVAVAAGKRVLCLGGPAHGADDSHRHTGSRAYAPRRLEAPTQRRGHRVDDLMKAAIEAAGGHVDHVDACGDEVRHDALDVLKRQTAGRELRR